MATKIGTISNALLLIGDTPLNSLDEPGYRTQVCSNLYDNIYESELISHTWGFARKLQQLNLTTDVPVIGTWTKIYQCPTDLISIMRVVPATDYEIYGDKIYSNAPSLTLDYYSRIDESMWPNYFAKLMEYALAKEIAIPLREDTQAAQLFYNLYKQVGQKARAVESKQRIQRAIQDQPFIDVRYS